MSHDDFDFEPVRGLPAQLPEGERLLWQGTPEWKSLAARAYHVRKVAAYFALLLVWRIGMGLYNGYSATDIGISCLLLVTFGTIAIGVLSLLAYFNARSTVYSITSARVILRHGVAVPLTMTIPFRLIDAANVKTHGDTSGDIAFTLPAKERIGYLISWPHVRSGKITHPEPCFRSLGDAQRASAVLGAALAEHAGTNAIHLNLTPRAAAPRTAGPRAAATA